MAFESPYFVGLALAVVVVLRLCRSGPGRDMALGVANLIFLVSFARAPLDLVPLLAFVAVGYAAIMAARRHAHLGLTLLVSGILSIFIWLKHYSIVAAIPALDFPYVVVGLSYVLFRILHLVIDVAQGAVRMPGALSYFNYCFFFLTFVAGPIQRYQDFSEQQNRPAVPPTLLELYRSLGRALQGYLYLVLLANLLSAEARDLKFAFYAAYAGNDWPGATMLLASTAALYFLFLYVNFAGYMHIVIGLGRLAGHSLPENFDQPYKATNLMDFWQRWHITLSEWLKTYLFNPLLKALAERWSSTVSINHLATIAFFITFVTMGVWHGTSAQFLVYGLFLGLGVTLNKIWQGELAQRLGRKGYKELSARGWYRHLARAITLAYMAIALICIWIDREGSTFVPAPRLLGLAGLGCCSAAFLFLTLSFWGIGPIVAYCAAAGLRLRDRLLSVMAAARWHPGESALLAWTAAKVFVLVACVLALNWTAEVVYQGF